MRPYHSEGGITIYHGDCRDFIDKYEPMAADAVVTDPPYGIEGGSGGDARDFRKAVYVGSDWEDSRPYIERVVVPIISDLRLLPRMAVTPGVRSLFLYPEPRDIGCFWTPAAATHGPWGFTTFQPILYYGSDYRAGKGALPSGRAVTEASEKNGHPCPKPLRAWTWLVDKLSQPGETVLDPFMGSGTTLRAAKDLGRKAIGIEIEERYCEIAANRLGQEVLDLGMAA